MPVFLAVQPSLLLWKACPKTLHMASDTKAFVPKHSQHFLCLVQASSSRSHNFAHVSNNPFVTPKSRQPLCTTRRRTYVLKKIWWELPLRLHDNRHIYESSPWQQTSVSMSDQDDSNLTWPKTSLHLLGCRQSTLRMHSAFSSQRHTTSTAINVHQSTNWDGLKPLLLTLKLGWITTFLHQSISTFICCYFDNWFWKKKTHRRCPAQSNGLHRKHYFPCKIWRQLHWSSSSGQ